MGFHTEAMRVQKRVRKENRGIGTVIRRAVGAFLHEAVTHQAVRRKAAERPRAEAIARITTFPSYPQIRPERAIEHRRSKTE